MYDIAAIPSCARPRKTPFLLSRVNVPEALRARSAMEHNNVGAVRASMVVNVDRKKAERQGQTKHPDVVREHRCLYAHKPERCRQIECARDHLSANATTLRLRSNANAEELEAPSGFGSNHADAKNAVGVVHGGEVANTGRQVVLEPAPYNGFFEWAERSAEAWQILRSIPDIEKGWQKPAKLVSVRRCHKFPHLDRGGHRVCRSLYNKIRPHFTHLDEPLECSALTAQHEQLGVTPCARMQPDRLRVDRPLVESDRAQQAPRCYGRVARDAARATAKRPIR